MSRQRLGVGLVLKRSTGEEMYICVQVVTVQVAMLPLCSVAKTLLGQRKVFEGRSINGEVQVPTCLEGSYPKLSVVGAGVGFWAFDGIHQ